MVCKIFICSEFPDIPDKADKKKKRRKRSYGFQSVMRFTQTQQEVQGLQEFAFPVVAVNDEHAKSRFKRKLRG